MDSWITTGKDCEACKGTGVVKNSAITARPVSCPKCNGKGYVLIKVGVKVLAEHLAKKITAMMKEEESANG